MVNQLKNIYDSFFLNECERCRGTGLVTCPHVSRPARPHVGFTVVRLSPSCRHSRALRRPCAAPPAPAASTLRVPNPSPRVQCHGTKNLRRRPGYLRTRDFQIVDDPRDSYLCFYCGPNSQVCRAVCAYVLRVLVGVAGLEAAAGARSGWLCRLPHLRPRLLAPLAPAVRLQPVHGGR